MISATNIDSGSDEHDYMLKNYLPDMIKILSDLDGGKKSDEFYEAIILRSEGFKNTDYYKNLSDEKRNRLESLAVDLMNDEDNYPLIIKP
ncbi:hypothetical protein ACT4R9_11515 [Ornithobacterium rhinotracheale]|uniref:hypothetical protein n=1 Tax=Ornithobacterium rhinotracheale TaxID=28251 RepID=UPI003FA46ADF